MDPELREYNDDLLTKQKWPYFSARTRQVTGGGWVEESGLRAFKVQEMTPDSHVYMSCKPSVVTV